ncbi:hypothetical protein LSAT2_024822 [Lamellibrachia satsuma]|nr:hypothetical protein LSAT2_024822 [Lamellibrachia satsuma]
MSMAEVKRIYDYDSLIFSPWFTSGWTEAVSWNAQKTMVSDAETAKPRSRTFSTSSCDNPQYVKALDAFSVVVGFASAILAAAFIVAVMRRVYLFVQGRRNVHVGRERTWKQTLRKALVQPKLKYAMACGSLDPIAKLESQQTAQAIPIRRSRQQLPIVSPSVRRLRRQRTTRAIQKTRPRQQLPQVSPKVLLSQQLKQSEWPAQDEFRKHHQQQQHLQTMARLQNLDEQQLHLQVQLQQFQERQQHTKQQPLRLQPQEQQHLRLQRQKKETQHQQQKQQQQQPQFHQQMRQQQQHQLPSSNYGCNVVSTDSFASDFLCVSVSSSAITQDKELEKQLLKQQQQNLQHMLQKTQQKLQNASSDTYTPRTDSSVLSKSTENGSWILPFTVLSSESDIQKELKAIGRLRQLAREISISRTAEEKCNSRRSEQRNTDKDIYERSTARQSHQVPPHRVVSGDRETSRKPANDDEQYNGDVAVEDATRHRHEQTALGHYIRRDGDR